MFTKTFFALSAIAIAISYAGPTPSERNVVPGSYKYDPSTPTALDPSAEELEWLKSVNWDGTILPIESVGTVYLDEPGAPLANTTGAKVKRAETKGIFICIDVNWGGQCGYAQQPINECVSLGSPWWHQISSWGPDGGQKCYGYGGGYCKWWSPDGCDADSCWRYGGNPSIGPVRAPGISNTGQWQDGNFNWNDQVGSWICYNE